MSRRKQYTDKDLLDYLRHFRYEINRSPRKKDFEEHPECPYPETYEDRFGSWNEAKKQVGLAVFKPELDEEILLEDLRQAAGEVEGKLTSPEYNERGRFWTADVRKHFGCWNAGKKAADLEAASEGSEYGHDELLNHLVDLQKDLDDMPSESDINEADGPVANTYRNHFGSLITAKQKAKGRLNE